MTAWEPGATLALAIVVGNRHDPDDRAVFRGTIDGDLELAWQEGEFRVQGRPLADDLRPGATVFQLVGGGTGKRVRRDIADAIARGLDGVHLDRGQLFQNVRNVDQ